jgi:hypothetical protein
MFNLFQFAPVKKIGFEDVLIAISHPNQYILINTLPASTQHCLITHTIPIEKEETIINEMLNQYSTLPKTIIIYGKHACDETVEKKYKQLLSLGLTDTLMYVGGLFEWLLLQDVFGENAFPTEGRATDILAFRPDKNAVFSK